MPEPLRGERLLETARGVLIDELLPVLPADKRHAALMVANAMAIAARTMSRLGAVVPNDARAEADRRLCESIRRGSADAGAEARQVHARLLADIRAKVEVSNPKYLVLHPGAPS
jgi:hypothetical protein